MERDPAIVSMTMSHIRGKDTGIELKLRKALASKGVHYRLYSSKVFGHPDLVLPNVKIAIFCDSEFWHGKNFEEAQAKIHKNTAYWIPKIKRNIQRDEEVNQELARQGYLVLRYWGEEINKELDRVVEEILAAIEKRKHLFALKQQSLGLRTTLAYIEDNDSYLLLHRVKKKQDVNEGKWIGIGGKLEAGETPFQAMKREIKEETGLEVLSSAYLGKIDFLNSKYTPERMYLYKVTKFEGELIDCDEGELKWIKKSEMFSLPMWEGDKAFLPLLETEAKQAFDLTLVYEGDELTEILGPAYPPLPKKKVKKKKAKRKIAKKD